MSLLKTIAATFTEALFPVPAAEREVMALGGQTAFTALPRAARSPVPEACSVFSYKDERAWRLIWSVKYKKSAEGTAIAGYALYQAVRLFSRALENDDGALSRIVIVPMPMTARRRRERGFNQCELMADEMERLDAIGGLDAPKNAGARLVVARDLLVRKVHTSRQTLKDRVERLESAKDIFAVNEEAARRFMNEDLGFKKEDRKAAMIIVIDDVITTGGTMRDAVGTLRKAGFENAWGLSVAH